MRNKTFLNTMKAILRKRYGPPSVLEIGEAAKPVPKADQVLIRVHAAEVTKADCEMRSFRFPVLWFWLPLRLVMGIFKPRNQIIGGYFAGEVVEVGSKVSRLQVGDQVYGSTQMKFGAYGEFICLPENYTIVRKPENLSYEESAALPLGALNAIHFMRLANIQRGDTLLVNGAGGSIGLYAMQIAKTLGAEVTAVDKGIKRQAILKSGADHFIDYQKQDFTESSQRYDIIFDMVARKNYRGAIRKLSPKGRYLLGNPRSSDMIRSFFANKPVRVAFARESHEELNEITRMAENATLHPTIDRVVKPSQIAEAHRLVESEERQGCIVLSLNF